MTDLVRHSEPFVDGLYFGECPRWHDGRLWYSDFYASTVSSAGEDGDVRVEVEVPGEPAGLGWLPDGRLLVVARKPRTVLRREPDGTLVLHAELAPAATFHANDMVVCQDGRAYVGNFGFDLDRFIEERGIHFFDPPRPPTTVLIRVDPDGTTDVAADDMDFPNGTVVFPDGRTLVVAETLSGRLTAFEIGPDGSLVDRRVWAQTENCSPDGICLDAEGRIWVANAVAPECLLVAEGGKVVDRVETSQSCFACMLGGADRRTLYLVTAPISTESVVSASRSGRIERVEVDVPGAGLP
ncbi:MAG TPA: SMP-30/gluconolactonase/LRE family protein [Acidimicrobiales bacterium]|nr:SMP-30/gluconolactonase/LRE family protein [Acidimicrobiales bacterium]